MGVSGAVKCRECGGEMEEGDILATYGGVAARFRNYGEFRGDKVVPFYCKNCGYIELYKRKESTESFDKLHKGGVGSHEWSVLGPKSFE